MIHFPDVADLNSELSRFLRSGFSLGFNLCASVIFLFVQQSFVTPCAFVLPNFVLINTMSCHLYRNIGNERHQDRSLKTKDIQRAFEAAHV